MVPVAASSANPAGKTGLTENVAGLPPTEALSEGIGTPTVADKVAVTYVRLDGATTGAGGGDPADIEPQPVSVLPIMAAPATNATKRHPATLGPQS
jgi:hypothetical protein